jgi:putative transposase
MHRKRGGDIIRTCGGGAHPSVGVSAAAPIDKQAGTVVIKGYTSRKLLMEYKELSKRFWGRHFGGRRHFAASSGNVTDEVIKHYIENQELEESQRTYSFTVNSLDKL